MYGAGMAQEQQAVPPSGEYILFGKSMFDYSSGVNAYMNGGVPISHSLNITFDEEDNATFDGLLGTRNSYHPISGKYNAEKRRIDFTTPSLEISSLTPYVSLGSTDDAETLLCALNPYGLGYVEQDASLIFTYSDDFRSLYPSSGFGAGQAYLVNKGLYQIGSYDIVIYDAILLKKEQGISFNYDNWSVDIKNSFPDIPVETTFRIFNTGDESSDYVIGTSSSNFTVINPSGTLAPDGYVDIVVSFTGNEPGEYKSTVTITNEEEDLEFEMKALCVPLPDYSQIVTDGLFKFSTDSKYPWTISDEYADGPVALCGNQGFEKTESPLYAEVTVSDKHAGCLSWKGYCNPYHPTRDVFGVMVDGETCYVSPNGGGTTDSSIEIAPGSHTIEFVYLKGPKVNGAFATGDDYAWINNLCLKETGLEQYAFSVSANRATFEPKSILKKGANATTEIVFRNEGWDTLTILSWESDNEAFSAEITSEEVNTFSTASVKLLFHTFTPGQHSGNVTIHTNAGNVVIKCNGEAVSVPDFSPIVTKGEFDFDTTIAYPFKVDNNVAYNSTSKKTDRKYTSSMLQANFEIPEGCYGELTWNARVSTSGAEGDEITDYATVYIDGEDIALDYSGETISNQYDFAPSSVNFYPGQHFICFGYTQAGDGKFKGDDRIEVSNLSLEVKQMSENEVRFWGKREAEFNDVWISKVYQREIKLTNFGLRNLQIKSVTYEGEFTTNINTERYYNTFEEIPVVITYIPKTPGYHEGSITLDTTAGKVVIKCHASVIDDPMTLLIEDFEDDWRFWDFVDVDGDGMTWSNVMVPQNAFHGEHALQSFSIHSDFTEAPIDDIAMSPEVAIPSCGAKLSFYLACYFPAYQDGIEILAGTGDDYTTYQPIANFDLKGVAPYYNLYECSLDDLAGKTVRIAFRHALDIGVMSFVAIDDILVTSNQADSAPDILDDMEICSIEYYNMQGMKVLNPECGFYIKRIVYANGLEHKEKIKITR